MAARTGPPVMSAVLLLTWVNRTWPGRPNSVENDLTGHGARTTMPAVLPAGNLIYRNARSYEFLNMQPFQKKEAKSCLVNVVGILPNPSLPKLQWQLHRTRLSPPPNNRLQILKRASAATTSPQKAKSAVAVVIVKWQSINSDQFQARDN